MPGQIISVDSNLPIPPGTDSNNSNNPKSTIKNLMMTSAQANADSQHDPLPAREGFESRSTFSYSILYLFLSALILYFTCRRRYLHGIVVFGVAVLLVYLERNLNRIV
jgi:hypothetical protein